jgi:hypothetical protein
MEMSMSDIAAPDGPSATCRTTPGACGAPAPARPLPRLPGLLAATGWARRIDAPVALFLAILAGLAVAAPAQGMASARFTAESFLGILPFLALSVATAAGLRAAGLDQSIARVFAGREVRMIVAASLFGALSPFCSCGVIPVVVALLAAGVPIAPVLAFCIASPIMDPEMFILTAAGIGVEFALVKTAAAVAMGLLAGGVSLLLTRAGLLDDALKAVAKPSCCGSKPIAAAAPVLAFWRERERRNLFWREAGATGLFLARWLALAFLLESLMVAWLPADHVARWLGEGNGFAIPLAVGLGIPAYLNGYAAIPLVAGLIDLGMSPAVGLAFMLAGSVTSIPAAIAVWSFARPPLFALYLAVAAGGALLAAFAYGSVLSAL